MADLWQSLTNYGGSSSKKKTSKNTTTPKPGTIRISSSIKSANTGKYSAPSSAYRAEIERKLKTGAKFTNEAAARKAAPDLFAKYSKTTTKKTTGSTAAANTGKYAAPSSSYRAEIERKLKTGSKFTDEAAARKAAPDLFAKYSKTTTSSGRRPTGYENLPLPESIQRSRTSMATYRPEPPKVGQPLFGLAITPGMQYANRAVQQGGNPYLSTAGGLAKDILFALPGAAAKTIGTGLRAAAARVIPKVAPAAPVIAAAGQRATQVGRTGSSAIQRTGQAVSQATQAVIRPVLETAERIGTGPVGQRLSNLPLVRTVAQATSRPGVGPALGGAGVLGGAALVGGMMPTGGAPGGGIGGPGAPSPGPAVPQPDVTSLGGGTPQGTWGGGYGGGYTGNTMGGTPAGAQGQTMDTTAFPPLPGEQAQTLPPEQPLPEQPPMPEVPDWNAMLQEYYDVIQQSAQQNAALATSFLNNALQQLDQLQAQIMAQYQQMGQGIDPATQAALQNLRDEINQRRQNLMEEMNRRGLLQSGVWLEMENRILKGQMTQEEQLIASRLADVQNQMTDALMQFASQRMNLMGQAAQNQMSIGQWAGQAQLGALQNVQTQQNQWNQWWQGIQEQRRQQAQEQARWQYEQNLARAQQIADWTGTIPQGFPGAGQQTWQARMDQQKLAQAGSTGTSRTATSKYLEQIPTYASRDQALADFSRYQSIMAAEGADTQAILNAIYSYFGG